MHRDLGSWTVEKGPCQFKLQDALDNEDVNGAAAVALKQLLTSKPSHVSPNALQVGGSHAQCLFLLCLLLNETHGGDHPRLRTLAGRH